MTFSKTLILFLPLFFLMNKVVSQSDSTYFTYDSFTSSSKDLIYQGDAFVPSTSSFARLTSVYRNGKPSPFSVGRVLYSPPVKFWEPGRQVSFETTIKFNITPVDNNPGDGLTFFIIPVDSPIPFPSSGGNFGLFDLYTGVAPSVFAVEFDIFYGGENAKWDPPYRHIGIDINSRVSKKVSRLEGALGREVTARINYGAWTKTVDVTVTYESGFSTLYYTYDLKTVLPQAVQVGISASTGGSTVALHDLHYWQFESTLYWEDDVVGVNNTYISEYV